ncbi:MAG TPA: YitT family protein [Lachnospiraceae bacterium]|nr:YitT family protein [Lachnospiraceae bacterium]
MNGYCTRPSYVDYAYMVLGTGLTAFAIQSIYEPNNLVVGGFSGIAIVLKALTENVIAGGIPLWLTNILLNVPFFLIAWKLKGAKFIGRSAFCTIALSVWLYLLPDITFVQDNLFLAAVFGGAIHGAGMGFVFITKATTGGTDMVGAIIQHFFPQMSVAKGMMLVDGCVVVAGACVFGVEPALYAVIAIVVVNRIADTLIEGVKYAKAVYIITDKYEEVSQAILHKVDRGLTGIYAKGMYTGKDRYILYCVLNKKELVRLKEQIEKIDPSAFVIVSDAREAMGQGFHPVE